jgi:hypothetical protein
MSAGPSLINADAGTYAALGEGGEPVWRRAAQLRAAIDTRLGKRHADLFAIPHEHAGRIDWRAPFDGTPRPYAALSDTDKHALQAKVHELRPDLERLVDRLDAAGRSDGERAFGRLLRLALTAPGPETLFSVDGRPVLTFWGFAGAGTPGLLLGVAATPATTLAARSGAATPPGPPPAASWAGGPTATPTVAPGAGWTAPAQPGATPPAGSWPSQAATPSAAPPQAAAPAWGAAAGGTATPPPSPGAPPLGAAPPGAGPPYPPVPPAGPAPAATTAAVAPPSASFWLTGLLIAGFLLLLLAVAAYVVKPYLPRWVWDGKFTLPSTAGPPPGAPTGVDDSALRAEQAREAALRADHARLWTQFNDRRGQCAPGRQGTVVPGGGTVVVPGTGDGTTVPPGALAPDGKSADATRPADAAKPPADARRAAAPKTDTQPPAPSPKAAADPKADPKAGQPRPQQQAARPTDPRAGQTPGERPIDPVRIPPEPGVRFMQGDWRSSTDLTTQSGDEVVRPQYTFDKDGKGKTKIIQKNGVVCEGPAEASRGAGGKLVIRETEALKCSDGTTYAPSTVTCDAGRDGRAQCQGSTEGGPTYAVQLGK